MECNVFYEDTWVVRVEYDDIIFTIKKESGVLCEFCNDGPLIDAVIPHILPSGHQIQYLASDKLDVNSLVRAMVKGKFGKITISDGIIVGCSAFHEAKAKEIVWNDCLCIPQGCFSYSKVEEVTNIMDVQKVMPYAFLRGNVKEITWPNQCKSIPDGCFEGCGNLEKLDNIKHIEFIGKEAFFKSSLSALDLSDTNISYLVPKSLYGLPKDCKITPPYYIGDSDFAKAL